VGIDERLAKHLRVIWASVTEASGLVSLVNSHAPDDDPVPAGTGHCRCCETFCRPDAKNPGNRLRAGLCPPCYESRRRWQRRNPDGAYMDFVRWRRRQLSGAA
jgi:hypothetical protein